MRYQKKTKPALWTTLPSYKASIGRKRESRRIPLKSKSKIEKDRQYEAIKREWWKKPENFYCRGLCASRHLPTRATDVHHFKGRNGRLQCDTRFFIPLCRECHDWAGNNIEAARKMGLICEKGKWNSNG